MNLIGATRLFLMLCLVSLINSAFTIIDIEKAKDLKKTISTKTNLMVLYASSLKNSDVISVRNLLKSVDGSFAVVDCTNKDLKKICKKALPEGGSYVLKHFKDGNFNKDYDRQMTKNSLQNFLRDPTGEFPYEEDPTAKDVVHLLETSVSDTNEHNYDAKTISNETSMKFSLSTVAHEPFFFFLQQLEKLMRKEKHFLVMF